MLIRNTTWLTIREQFTEDEKSELRLHVTGETICPPGICIDETALPAELAEKLKKAKVA
jgi:hypothetical protein